MIRFKKYLTEIAAANVSWLASASSHFLNGAIPLGPIFDKHVAHKGNAYHKCSFFSFQKIVALQGGKKAISVATTFDPEFFLDPGIEITGDDTALLDPATPIVVELEGIIKEGAHSDISSNPDKTGRRWVHPHRLGVAYETIVEDAWAQLIEDIAKGAYFKPETVEFLDRMNIWLVDDVNIMGALDEAYHLFKNGKYFKSSLRGDEDLDALKQDFLNGLSKMIKIYIERVNVAIEANGTELKAGLGDKLKTSTGWASYSEYIMNQFKIICVYVDEDHVDEWKDMFKKHHYDFPIKSDQILYDRMSQKERKD